MALESVIAERMRVNAVISAHQALSAGAGVAQVAAAMGCSCSALITGWRSWARGQVELGRQVPGLGLTAEAFTLVEDRLVGVCDGCPESPPGGGGHVGSPHS